MPTTDSARARAARRERQEQREKEAQAQVEQILDDAIDVRRGQVDEDGDQRMIVAIPVANPVIKQEVLEETQAPAEDPLQAIQDEIDEEIAARRPTRIRKHNRVNERQRKPMNKFKEDRFTREILWMFFLNLRHENEGTKDAVIRAVEPALDPLSYQYEDLWKGIMGRVNHLRGQTTGYLKAHVSDMLKLDTINGGRLNSLTTQAELAAFFQSIYSVSKFLEVFYFTQSIVDLRNQSPLALYYTKSLYANACAKTKLHLDWAASEKAYNEAVELKKRQERKKAVKKAKAARATNDDVATGDLFGDGTTSVTESAERLSLTQSTAGTAVDLTEGTEGTDTEKEIVIPPFDKMSPHNREGLVVYLNNFPLAPQFAQVTRKEFKEKNAKRTKKPKAEPTHVAVGLNNLFFDGEPPKPSAR